MKKTFAISLILLYSGMIAYSQVTIYSENFNSGFGGWTNTDLTTPWGNTVDGFGLENIWQNSDDESGMAPNVCGAGGQGNPTLYMGATGFSTGAAYSATADANRRISSPNINTTGYSNLTLSFNFIGNGCGTRDRAYFQYSVDGGTNWISATGAPTSSNPALGTGGGMDNLKSQICTGGQGRWTNVTWAMPASCENITNLKIAFVWQNSNSVACNTATDPSFAVDNIIITAPSSVTPPVADFSASETSICAGECINFTDLSTNTPTTWNWTFTGAATPSSSVQNPTGICYNTPGTYTVTLEAGNAGGSDTEIKTNYITVYANPTVNLGPDTTICSGDNLTLDAGAGFTGYTWLPSGSTQTINVTTGGTYSVTVTDGNTCQGSYAITVSVLTHADATITSGTEYCSNDAAVNLTAIDPGGTWWGPGITNPSAGTFNPGTAGAGVHTVFYGIAGSCGDTSSTNITVYAAPTVNLGPDTTICSGDNLTLDAGAGYAGYSWLPSGSTQTINVTTGGTYSVTVTDGNTCQGSYAITVSVLTHADATITSGTEYCSNDAAVNLTAIDPGGTWWGPGITNPSAGTFNPGTAGAGVHTVFYGIAGSCGDTSSTNITVYAAPTVNLGPDTTICSGDNLTLDAGAGYAGYSWLPSGSTQTINVTTGGTYSVTVTDGNTCQGSYAITVSVLTQADATITSGTEYCSNDAAVNLTAIDPGGTWWGPGITNPSAGTFNPGTAGAGVHIVYYGIAGSCGDTASANVTVYAAPTVNLGPDTTICSGDNLTLDAGAGFTGYTWLPSGSTQTINVTTGGTYSVTVTDGNTCQGSYAITVSVLTQADATITSGTEYCSNDAAVNLTAVDPGGSWTGTGITNGSTGLFSPGQAGAGTHTIYYSIAGLCGDMDSVDITVWPSPSAIVYSYDESCIGAGDGWAYSVVTGGTLPYSVEWSNSATTDTVTDLTPGSYVFTVTDANGCSSLSMFTVLPGADECLPPHVYIPNIFSPNGDGENDVLYVRGEGIEYLEFIIYNRWGQKIFETTSQEKGWDGSFRGNQCDTGVFSYILRITWTGVVGEREDFSGTITLVR